MLQLRVFFVANVAFTRFFCRKYRDYALFGVEFWQKFWQKVLEILRILAEILRKKLACGASDFNCNWCGRYMISDSVLREHKEYIQERTRLHM